MPNVIRNDVANATRSNFEYLAATLSKRTKGKMYENFIVNYIWYALNDGTLKPVTQQYVNRRDALGGQALVDFSNASTTDEEASGGRHALIDLYFPQLHVGVECDESGHFYLSEADGLVYQNDADLARSKDISRAIPDYLELRVPVQIAVDREAGNVAQNGGTLTPRQKRLLEPAELLASLDEVVERIRERKRLVEASAFEWAPDGFKPWLCDRADWQLAREVGEVRVGDGLLYRHNGELRALFSDDDTPSVKPSHFQTNFYPSIENHVVWAPSLSVVDRNGDLRSTNTGGYLNVYFTEGTEKFIGQADPTPESVELRKRAKADGRSPLPPYEYPSTSEPYEGRVYDDSAWNSGRRITFAKSRDAVGRTGYQFMGVFEHRNGDYHSYNGITFLVSRLVADSVDLSKSTI